MGVMGDGSMMRRPCRLVALLFLSLLPTFVVPDLIFDDDDASSSPTLSPVLSTYEPTGNPTTKPSLRPTFEPAPQPTGEPVPSPTSLTPTSPPHPFPSHLPTTLPSLFEDIHIYEPVADTYNYALQLVITWKTQGAGAISECGSINVELYQQQINGYDSFVADIYVGYPNDLYVTYPWIPGDTSNPENNEPYGDKIVGTNYKIRLQCAASITYSAYSEYFDLSLTSQPTHVPTPLPSPQPTPLPTMRPSEAPTPKPTPVPSPLPTISLPPSPLPTLPPSILPTPVPSTQPSEVPTLVPSPVPFPGPTGMPSPNPTPEPTPMPSASPSPVPSPRPTARPTLPPTPAPTHVPVPHPTQFPIPQPTPHPSHVPSHAPSPVPTESRLPTRVPTPVPTSPSAAPTQAPHPNPWTSTAAISSYAAGGALLCLGTVFLVFWCRRARAKRRRGSGTGAGVAAFAGAGGGLGQPLRDPVTDDAGDEEFPSSYDDGSIGAMCTSLLCCFGEDTSVGGRGFKGNPGADPAAFLDSDPSTRLHRTEEDSRHNSAFSPFLGGTPERRDSDFSFTGSI